MPKRSSRRKQLQTTPKPGVVDTILASSELILIVIALVGAPLVFQKGFDTFRYPKIIFHVAVNVLIAAVFCVRKTRQLIHDGALPHPASWFAADPVRWPLLAVACVWGLSGLVASNGLNARHDLVIFGSFLFFFAAIKSQAEHTRSRHVMIGAMLVTAAVSCVIAVFQYNAVDLVGNLAGLFGQTIGLLPRQDHFVRHWVTVGLVGQPTLFAGYLGILIPVSLSVAFATKRLWLRVSCAALALLMLLVIFLTHTRGMIVVTPIAVALAFAGITIGKRGAAKPLLIGAGGVFLVTGGLFAWFIRHEPTFLDKLMQLQNYVNSATYRIFFWKVAARMGLENPVLGLGPGGFRFHSMDYRGKLLAEGTRLPIDQAAPIQAHSEFLQFFAETGLLGMLAMAWLLLTLTRCFIRSRHSSHALLAAGCFGGLLAMLGNSLFSFPMHIIPSASAVTALVAIWLGTNERKAPPRTLPLPVAGKVGLWAVQAAAVLAAAMLLPPLWGMYRANSYAYIAQNAQGTEQLSMGVSNARQAARLASWKAEFWWLYGTKLYQLEDVRRFPAQAEDVRILNRLMTFTSDFRSVRHFQVPQPPINVMSMAKAFNNAADALMLADFAYHAGRSSYLTGDLERAVKLLEAVMAVTPSGDERHPTFLRDTLNACLALATERAANGDGIGAEALLRRTIALDDDNADARAMLAVLLLIQREQPAEAQAMVAAALERDSQSFLANFMAYRLARRRGNIDEAAHWLERTALHPFVGNPEVRNRILSEIAAFIQRTGHSQLAVTQVELTLGTGDLGAAQQLLSQLPQQVQSAPEILYVRALIANQAGQRDQALQLVEQTLAARPHHYPALVLRSRLL